MSISSFADVEIRILPKDDSGYPVELTMRGEQEFKGRLDADFLPWISTQDDVADGRRLFDWLFADLTLRAAWIELRGRAPLRHLHLRIDEDAPELHTVPWELLRDTSPGGDDQPLAASASTPFARYLAGATLPGQPITRRPVKMLVVIANPANLEAYDLTPIQVEAEVETLRQVTQDLNVELRFFPPALKAEKYGSAKNDSESPPYCTLSGLQDELAKGVHLLHFIGHGTYNQEKSQAALFMATAENEVSPVTQDDFVAMIRQHLLHGLASKADALHLIYLSACQSATRSPAAAFRAFAPHLIQSGIPSVLAMQDLISQESAQIFGRTFYQQLLRHGVAGLACNEARAALLASRRTDAEVPVFLTRLVGTKLLAPDPIRSVLENMQRQRSGFFAEEEQEYLPLPVEVVHLRGQQRLHNLERTEANLTASSDLMDTLLTIFRRPAWLSLGRPELVLLIGDYGANKTTQLKRIALDTVREALHQPGRPHLLPIYVDLKVKQQALSTTGNPIIELLAQSLQDVWPEASAAQIEKLLSDAALKCRILIDHTSTLLGWERRQFYMHLYELMKQYSHNDYLLTTSPQLVDRRDFGDDIDVHVLHIQPLTNRKIRHFLQGLPEVGPKLLQHFTEKQIFDLASIPWIMVKLIRRAQTGRYPYSRTETMQRLFEESITHLPSLQGIRAHAEPLLIELAWQMQSGRTSVCSVDQVLEMVAEIRGSRGYRLEEFYKHLIEVGLLKPIGDDRCTFAHGRMRSFCAARAMQAEPQRYQRLDGILSNLDRPNTMRRWTQTLIFLSGLIARDSEKLKPFLYDLVFSANLLTSEQIFLAARCLMESKRQFVTIFNGDELHLASEGQRADAQNDGNRAASNHYHYVEDLEQQVLEALIWRLYNHNEPDPIRRARAARMLGQVASTPVAHHLANLAFRTVRRDLRGRYDYDLCNVRMAAAIALLRMPHQERSTTLKSIGESASQLFVDWEKRNVTALIKVLNSDSEEGLQGMAALALGEVYGQLKAAMIHDEDVNVRSLCALSLGKIIPRLKKLGREIPPNLLDARNAFDALSKTFFDSDASEAVRWAIAHAFTYLDDNEVYGPLIQSFVEAQNKNTNRNLTRKLLQQYKCVAYIIGRERLQAHDSHRFLVERCIKSTADPRLWGVAIEALGLLADPRHRNFLQQIAAGDVTDLGLESPFAEEHAPEFIQEKAIRALATVGNYATISTLRAKLSEEVHNNADWSPTLKRAYFETSEEIYWRQRHLVYKRGNS